MLAAIVACGEDPAASPSTGGTAAVASTPTVAEPSTPGPGGQGGPDPSPEPATAAPTPTERSVQPTPTPTAVPAPTAELVTRSSMARDDTPDVPDADLASLVEGNSDFAVELYRSLSGNEGNLFFSPHSISTALAMAYAGARGETERQMADTLRFHLPQDRLHPAFNALDVSVDPPGPADASEEFRLNVANSAWGQTGFGFLPDYLDALAVNYGEEVRPVDFRNDAEAARSRINEWVAGETGDRIRDLIPSGAIGEFTRLVLANAIYFKAAWLNTFDENATVDRPFHLLDGTRRDVPMMRQRSNLRYASGDGYQAVELPYAGGEVAMTALVPDRGRFREFEESLSGSSLEAILEGLDRELVLLSMPRFETESAFSLSDTLADMGMPDAFSEQAADFSGMDGRSCQSRGDICLLISDVLHKAFVAVDEEGTEAAAATAVIISTTRAVEEPEPVELTIDRPFLFIIHHLETGAVLFLGRVLSP